MLVLFKSSRCVSAEWSYENGESLREYTVGRALWEWDGRGWVPGLWSMLPPPFHVGIDLQASGVSYTITLDAWMPAARLTGTGIDRTFRFESGLALTRAIATLKAIVESAHLA